MTSKYCNTGANAIFLREQRRQAEWSLWQHQDTDAHFFQVISIGAELWLLPTRQHDALLLQWIYEPSCLFLSLKLSPYTPSIYFFQYSFVFSSLFGENTTSRYEIFFSFWTFFTQFLLDTMYSLCMYPVCVCHLSPTSCCSSSSVELEPPPVGRTGDGEVPGYKCTQCHSVHSSPLPSSTDCTVSSAFPMSAYLTGILPISISLIF